MFYMLSLPILHAESWGKAGGKLKKADASANNVKRSNT